MEQLLNSAKICEFSRRYDRCMLLDCSEDIYNTIIFKPGPLGMKLEGKTGKIDQVLKGQAYDAGVRPGWRIVNINGVKYNITLYDEKKHGSESYEITFEQERYQDRI